MPWHCEDVHSTSICIPPHLCLTLNHHPFSLLFYPISPLSYPISPHFHSISFLSTPSHSIPHHLSPTLPYSIHPTPLHSHSNPSCMSLLHPILPHLFPTLSYPIPPSGWGHRHLEGEQLCHENTKHCLVPTAPCVLGAPALALLCLLTALSLSPVLTHVSLVPTHPLPGSLAPFPVPSRPRPVTASPRVAVGAGGVASGAEAGPKHSSRFQDRKSVV